MRFFILTIILSLLFVSQSLAISSINPDVMKEAQEYGILKTKNSLQEFLVPWTSYEEQAVKLDDTAERSYLYTPFLLIAADARSKSLNGRSIDMAGSEGMLENYSGLLSFSTVLFGKDQDFAKNSYVVIKQNKNVTKAYQIIVPSESERIVPDQGISWFKAQCYFYFHEEDILPEYPLILSIMTNDQQEHNFYFDVMKIK